jgi:hypothetical protein
MTVSAESELKLWLPQRVPSRAASLRLFCFPYAGGNAGIFANWQKILDATRRARGSNSLR